MSILITLPNQPISDSLIWSSKGYISAVKLNMTQLEKSHQKEIENKH